MIRKLKCVCRNLESSSSWCCLRTIDPLSSLCFIAIPTPQQEATKQGSHQPLQLFAWGARWKSHMLRTDDKVTRWNHKIHTKPGRPAASVKQSHHDDLWKSFMCIKYLQTWLSLSENTLILISEPHTDIFLICRGHTKRSTHQYLSRSRS